MIQSITVTNHLGESLILTLRSPEQSGFFIKGVDGLGPCKSTINMTEILSLDGALFNSSRIGSRNIVLNLGFMEGVADSIEDIRQKSYRYFPLKKKLNFKITTDNRIGNVDGYVESNEPNIFSKAEDTIVSLLCPSPYFVADEVVQTLFSGYEAAFEFPFENPSITEKLIEFGYVMLDRVQTVFYTGDADTGILVRIHFLGPVHNLSIYNITRRETMDIDSAKLIALTGADFNVGDDLIISTVKGAKYIHLLRGGEVINILNVLAMNVDWFQVGKGDNLFSFTADTGETNIQFSIEHSIIYEGI